NSRHSSVLTFDNNDDNDYGTVIFRSRSYDERRFIIRGIKAKYVKKSHIEPFYSSLVERFGRNLNTFHNKIIIVCQENASVKDEARLNNMIIFVRESNLIPFLSLETY
ncbi:6552_t:CDS:1, partial [Cetraspora pellucida]